MDILSIISKKKKGIGLSKEEINFFVDKYTKGEIPDYQMAALLMSICLMKMNEEETYQLANAMKNSGDIIDLNEIKGIKVDKHSTGGVGDKITLVAGPLAAAIGVKVAKMSGRGLGFTGGTIDKMESIPNIKTSLEEADFFKIVNEIGLSVIGQTGQIAPADKKIYALRDVTETVDNISLIASSIMSKKLASGSDKIVLDIKCGTGGFMKTIEEAEKLAKEMIKIGKNDGKKTVALITDMNQPLGHAIGNSLEVIEAIETLKGKGPEDVTNLSYEIAGIMAFLGEKAKTIDEGKKMARKALNEGKGLLKLKEMIEKQGGNAKVIEDYDIFPKSNKSKKIIAPKEGYIEKIETNKIGMASLKLGAGREKKENDIDLGAGIYLFKKIGDYVEKGGEIAEIYTNKENVSDEISKEILNAITFSAEKTIKPKLIKKILDN